MTQLLDIKGLTVQTVEQEMKIIDNLSLSVNKGEIVALMGPNGSGKSTLSSTLMGHPAYEVTSGSVLFDGEDIQELEPDERARKGLFLSFQYPSTVAGVTLQNFLRTAYNAVHDEPLSVPKFRRLLKEKMQELGIDVSFANRYVNDGWSGGEKKRGEILQLAMLKPKLAILDETDSGLDIDAIKVVSDGVNKLKTDNPETAVLVITHYKRILEYIQPDRVVILMNGKIVEQGGPELVDHLEEHGYDWLREQN